MSVYAMAFAWKRKKLTSAQKLMLMAIADRCDDEGMCFPGIKSLAEKCDVNERTAAKTIAKLEELGDIVIVLHDGIRTSSGSTNRYYYKPYRESIGLKTPLSLSRVQQLEKKTLWKRPVKMKKEVSKLTPDGMSSSTPDGMFKLTDDSSVYPSGNQEDKSSSDFPVSFTTETGEAVVVSEKSFTEQKDSDRLEAVQETTITPSEKEAVEPLIKPRKRTNFKQMMNDQAEKEIVKNPVITFKPKTEKEALADEWTLAMLEGVGYTESTVNSIRATGQKVVYKFKKEAGQAKNIRTRLQEVYPDIEFKPSIIVEIRDWLLTDKSRNFTNVGYGGIYTHCLDYVGTVYLKKQKQAVVQENLVIQDDIYDKYASDDGEA